jgi:hypothetical protein
MIHTFVLQMLVTYPCCVKTSVVVAFSQAFHEALKYQLVNFTFGLLVLWFFGILGRPSKIGHVRHQLSCCNVNNIFNNIDITYSFGNGFVHNFSWKVPYCQRQWSTVMSTALAQPGPVHVNHDRNDDRPLDFKQNVNKNVNKNVNENVNVTGFASF